MENIAAEVGAIVCRAMTNLTGSGQAICYNISSTSTIGYSVILGVVLIIAFRRIFSQVG